MPVNGPYLTSETLPVDDYMRAPRAASLGFFDGTDETDRFDLSRFLRDLDD